MASFTVKTAKGSFADPSVFTEATETNATRYRLRNMMNQPSQCIVTLNDPNFASTQKYSDLGADTYFGLYSRCKVTDTALSPTTEFNGPIIRTVGNPLSGTVDLHCRDWLHQLDTRRIVYDTREDLDGSGLRESQCYRMDGINMHGLVVNGANNDLYDTVAGWSENDWTGSQHYLLFSGKMGGASSFWQGCYLEADVGPAEDQDYSASDRGDTWFNDSAYADIESAANSTDQLFSLLVLSHIDQTKITQVDLEVVWCSENADYFQILIAEHDTPAYQNLYEAASMPTSTSDWQHVRLTDIAGMIGFTNDDIFNASGVLDVRFNVDHDLVDADKVRTLIKYLRITIHYEGVAVNTTAYAIDDDDDDLIRVSEDLIAAGIDKHAPYCITQVVTAYVKDLVGTYDIVTTLDHADDLVASTNTVARHFHYMTPLEIMVDFAGLDGTQFWLDEDLDLHWNESTTFTPPPAQSYYTLTDANVLHWINPNIGSDQGLANEFAVLGQRYSDYQIEVTGSDATSQQNYGVHTMVVENPGIYHAADATDYAAVLETRFKTPVFNLGYAVMGNTADDVLVAKGYRTIGEQVMVTSTDMDLAGAEYIVTETRYDSTTGVQEVFLTANNSSGLFRQQMIQDGTRWVKSEVGHNRRHISFDPLHKETW